jgi:hypothetical protein
MTRFPTSLLVALLATAACGGVQGQVPPAPRDTTSLGGEPMVPTGFGRLGQDDISLRLSAGDLEVRFLPLEERVLRLLIDESYRAYRDLRESKRALIDSVAARNGIAAPGVALVTFFSARDGVRFDPQDLVINATGQQFRAVGVVPVSANFTNLQLNTREQASAILIFDRPLPLTQEFTLTYQAYQTDTWRARLSTITREKDRIAIRMRSVPADSVRRP